MKRQNTKIQGTWSRLEVVNNRRMNRSEQGILLSTTNPLKIISIQGPNQNSGHLFTHCKLRLALDRSLVVIADPGGRVAHERNFLQVIPLSGPFRSGLLEQQTDFVVGEEAVGTCVFSDVLFVGV